MHTTQQPGARMLAMVSALALLIGAATGAAAAPDDAAAPADSPVEIAEERGEIRIRLQEALLGDAMAQLGTAAGIAIEVAPGLRQAPISATVTAPTWGAAVLAVLEGYQTSIEWQDATAGQPRRIWVSGTHTAAAPAPLPATAAAPQDVDADSAEPPPEGDPTIWSQEPPDPFVPPPLDGPIFIPAR
jgi:hypothetical protein